MAKQLYDYWFVQFDFPNEEGKPYKSSGGKMVWNDELKREIPEGWAVETIGTYAHVRRGSTITKAQTAEGKIKVVAAAIEHSFLHNKANRDAYVITVSASGANAGFINFWREPIYASDCSTIQCNKIEETLYCYYWILHFQELLFAQQIGAAQPHVYPEHINKIPIVIPSPDILAKIKDLLMDSNQKQSEISREIESLSKQRDQLLPLLMNGQVSVNYDLAECNLIIFTKILIFVKDLKCILMARYKLKDCFLLIKNGAVIQQRKEAAGYPITRIETLSNGRFNRDRMGYADIFDITPYTDYILDDYDILMSHINSREFLGRTVLYRKEGDESIIHGMNVLRIKTNPALFDAEYANYFFQTAYFKKLIDSIRKDAINQSSIAISDICGLEIDLPSIEEQRQIAAVLSRIDRKISINRAINHNLEAMAKQLYDYWFVQFDFPNKEGKPYKSSGGKMVWNNKLKCDIPEGWEVKPLIEFSDIKNGATPSTANEANYGGDIIWITPKDLSDQKSKFIYQGERNISKLGYDSCSTNLLPINSVLMSSRAPIGLLSIAKCPLCTNQGFKSFVPYNMDDSIYLYYYIQHHIKQIEQLGSGTTFKEVSREDLCTFPILCIGAMNVYKRWIETQKQIADKQFILTREMAVLTKQRDELLPLLMNGQVSVNYDLSHD